MAKPCAENYDDLSRGDEVQPSSDRVFGFIIAAALFVTSVLGYWHDRAAWPALLAAAGIFAGLAVLAPRWLAPLNRLWTKLGLLLHRIVSPVIMAFLFFGVITPIGIAMRLAGRDLLRMRFDRTATSYWLERRPPGPAPETMRNQY
jgi:hypothetical protein